LSNNNPKDAVYCAFFTDCEHEVEEVTKGWRLVLQYDVYQNPYPADDMSKDDTDDEEDVNALATGWEELRWEPVTEPSSIAVAEIESKVETAVLEYLAGHDKGDRVAILFRHRYSLPSLKDCVLKGADSLLYDVFCSNKWNRKLQGIVLRWETDMDNEPCDIDVVPVSMDDFRGEESRVAPHSGTTRLILFKDIPPGYLFFERDYIEHTGNESSPAQFAYFACCMILEKVVRKRASIDVDVPDAE
jgi:hypothetical protein